MPQPNVTQTNDFDLQTWLADITADGSLSQDEVKSLGTILGNDKVKSKLRDQVLMRQDYSRKTQELADQRRQVEADVNEILKERQDLANWKAGLDNQLKKAYADLDSTRSSEAQFRARIQTIAEQSGLDPADLMQGLPAAAAATGAAAAAAATGGAGNGAGAGAGTGAPAVDTTKFVSAEDFSSFARRSPLLSAEVADIFDEHQELTGKPLKMEYKDSSGKTWKGRMALLVKSAEHNSRAGNKPMSVRDVWETDFNIPQLRQEQLRDSIRNEERGKLDAEYKTKLSEQLLNGGTPGRTTPPADRPKSILFDDKRDQRTPAEREAAGATGGTGDKGGGSNAPPPTSAAHETTRWQKAANSYIDRRAQGVPLGQEAPAKGSGAL